VLLFDLVKKMIRREESGGVARGSPRVTARSQLSLGMQHSKLILKL
jgi:hypothetical protein